MWAEYQGGIKAAVEVSFLSLPRKKKKDQMLSMVLGR